MVKLLSLARRAAACDGVRRLLGQKLAREVPTESGSPREKEASSMCVITSRLWRRRTWRGIFF